VRSCSCLVVFVALGALHRRRRLLHLVQRVRRPLQRRKRRVGLPRNDIQVRQLPRLLRRRAALATLLREILQFF